MAHYIGADLLLGDVAVTITIKNIHDFLDGDHVHRMAQDVLGKLLDLHGTNAVRVHT